MGKTCHHAGGRWEEVFTLFSQKNLKRENMGRGGGRWEAKECTNDNIEMDLKRKMCEVGLKSAGLE
jgi:hypothetical protein